MAQCPNPWWCTVVVAAPQLVGIVCATLILTMLRSALMDPVQAMRDLRANIRCKAQELLRFMPAPDQATRPLGAASSAPSSTSSSFQAKLVICPLPGPRRLPASSRAWRCWRGWRAQPRMRGTAAPQPLGWTHDAP